MAVPTGSGTETLHSHLMENVDASQTLIYGAQHHVYTVMSIIVYCEVLNATTDYGYLQTKGYGAHYSSGQTGLTMRFARFNIQVGETYVWNDKFSFNGYEPTDFTGPLDDATKQDAIADQGSAVSQRLYVASEHASDNFHVHVTFIDQNNS